MKILIVDASQVRGIAERMAWCVNDYTNHEARALIRGSWYDWSTWNDGHFAPKPPIYSLRNKNAIEECLGWADLIHFIQASSFRVLGHEDLLGKKPATWQVFGFVTSRWEDVFSLVWTQEELLNVRMSLVAEGWQRDPFWETHEFTHLPGLFMIHDSSLKPIPFDRRRRVVSFTPMNRSRKVAPKAVPQTQYQLRGLPVQTLYRIPFNECIQKKAEAWIGIDEVITPMVHFSGFEFLSLGVPCVNYWDSITESAIKEVTGGSGSPFINARLRNVRSVIQNKLDIPNEDWACESDRVRHWMESNYDPSVLIDQYIRFWER